MTHYQVDLFEYIICYNKTYAKKTYNNDNSKKIQQHQLEEQRCVYKITQLID